MTLDDERTTWRQMARADRDYYQEQARQDWLVRESIESEAGEEAKWMRIFTRMEIERAKEIHPSTYRDDRCFDVDGYTHPADHEW